MNDKTDMQRKNRKIAVIVISTVFVMVGLSFASVPLYDLFCRVTGYGGTTQQADQESDIILDREVTVRFDASINENLPWNFKPAQISVDLKVGQTGMAFYKARNTSSETLKGTATFNVTPQKAGPYFMKVDCFCFTEQVLKPGEEVDMPVTFFVDPEIADDPNMDDITTITLSYTFFLLEDDDEETNEKGTEKLADAS